MASNIVMRGKDAVSAKLAECFITIEGKRFQFMSAIELEAQFNRTKTQVPVLGRTGFATKSVGWHGTGSAVFHYNISKFRELMRRFKDGEEIYFTIQVINEDKTSASGRQVVILENCSIDSGILAKFDANGSYLTDRISFTFDDFKIAENFKDLDGMNC